MLFTQIEYLFFFSLFLLIYFCLPRQLFRSAVLLCFSYYFYAFWNIYYLPLIIFTTLVTFSCAIILNDYRRSKLILILGIILNLSSLIVFKYYDFFIANINSLDASIKFDYLNLILPVGISFYTFQGMAYLIDVYKGEIKTERNLLIYANFISFFPQLVAGPIERAKNLLPQLKREEKFCFKSLIIGTHLIGWGLFKKLVIADNIAPIVNSVYAAPETHGWLTLIFATYLFAFQIYCDFSGYCDIAVGSARSIGIKLSTNFRNPYIAISMRDFWERWHITLSHWFRDYVYKPLSVKKIKKNSLGNKTFGYLVLTFIISGFWHGAAWTFIAWGLLHGIYRLIEIQLGPRFWDPKNIAHKTLNMFVVFNLVCLAWIFFRANSIYDAVKIIQIIFTFESSLSSELIIVGSLFYDSMNLILVSITILYLGNYLMERKNIVKNYWNQDSTVHYIMLIAMALTILFNASTGENAFIYFQF